jgi:hypothetical protein
MATVKISDLPAATVPLDGTEFVPIVQGGITDRVSVANLTAGRTVNASALAATGIVSGATVTATGTVSGATVTATGTVSGATVTATGTVSGATVSGTTVSGTTVNVGAGTVSAPSISPTGDSNTGVFFPSADQIAFTEGGVEAMRIDASGNVGIGTSAPTDRLDANGNIRVRGVRIFQDNSAGGSFEIGPGAGTGDPNVWGFFAPASRSISWHTNATFAARLDTSGNFQFNSGYGSVATAFGCRAWVNFNGTGTVAIRASGNVSSITDNGTGDYTVNFTTAMPDVNYAVAGTTQRNTTNDGGNAMALKQGVTALTTTSVRIGTLYAGSSNEDCPQVHVVVFR